ncbi:MAG: hypothetical protein GTO14_03525 [Anaerolineales bacterium]|nr:hypothetical protein [Anaerolineales bacterium]
MRRMVQAQIFILLSLLLSACGRTAQHVGIRAWIDAPVDGLEIPIGQIVKLEGHAAGGQGVARIEFWTNGKRIIEQGDPESVGLLSRFEHIWVPESPGTYLVELVAYDNAGAESARDSITVYIVAEAVLGISDSETATPHHTTTATLSPETPTVTPTREFTRTLTPPPPEDTSGPPAPAPVSPKGGVTLACSAIADLKWNAVSDPSGIAEHRLALERHPGDSNWTAASGSPWSGVMGTSRNVSVECGWYYRWRVRAKDGVGNWGDFSSWATFAVTLD